MNSEIDTNIERLEKTVELFSNTMSLVTEIKKKIAGIEERRKVIEALIELVDAVQENIEDIDTATGILKDLVQEDERKLTKLEAGRLERSMKFANANLNQIGETLVTANEIAGSKFPVMRALLRSLENGYNDLLTILRMVPIPSLDNPWLDPGISSEIALFIRKKKSAVKEIRRITSRLQELK